MGTWPRPWGRVSPVLAGPAAVSARSPVCCLILTPLPSHSACWTLGFLLCVVGSSGQRAGREGRGHAGGGRPRCVQGATPACPRAGSRGEGQATHRRTPLSRQCFRELRRGALSPHIPPPSRGRPLNSPPSEKSTPAYMPPVMGSSLLQEAARNTRVSVLSAEPKSALWSPRIFPCLGHGTGGPAVLCAGGKHGAGTVSSTRPGRRACHQLPSWQTRAAALPPCPPQGRWRVCRLRPHGPFRAPLCPHCSPTGSGAEAQGAQDPAREWNSHSEEAAGPDPVPRGRPAPGVGALGPASLRPHGQGQHAVPRPGAPPRWAAWVAPGGASAGLHV